MPILYYSFLLGLFTTDKLFAFNQISRGRVHIFSILIISGIHAREWISVAVALFVIRQLVEFHKSYKSLVQDLDWYILPVANPDGYVYTHTTDRLWTKSRSLGDSLGR